MAWGASIALVGGLVALPAAAQAATTLQVNADPGVCTADGSNGTYCTIGAAAAKAAAGDTVQVAAGTYAEQVNAKTAGVIFDGSSGTAIVDGDPSLRQCVDPNQLPISCPALGYGFHVTAANVQVRNFTVQGQKFAGVYVDNATGVTIHSLTVTGSASYGIEVVGGSDNIVEGGSASNNASYGVKLAATDHTKVRYVEADHNGLAGVSVLGGHSNVVHNVTSWGNIGTAAQGIDVDMGADGTTLERNTVYGNGDSGIQVYRSSGTVVIRNLSHDNTDHGIDISQASTSTDVAGNTVIHNGSSGISVEKAGLKELAPGKGSQATLLNNIASGNGWNSTGKNGDIYVDDTSAPLTTLDYDLVGPGETLYLNGASYDLTGFQSATDPDGSGPALGQELHGWQRDPMLDGSYKPQAGSPAIDAASTLPVDEQVPDLNGDPLIGPPDIGAIEGGAVATNQPPTTPTLTATPTTVTEGGKVSLVSSASTDPEGGQLTYAFTCGDGSTATPDPDPTTRTATCTYTKASATPYTASVTVTDAQGATSTATAPITVNAATPPPPPTGGGGGSTPPPTGGGGGGGGGGTPPPVVTPPPTTTPPPSSELIAPTALLRGGHVRQGEGFRMDARGSHANDGATIDTYTFGCGNRIIGPKHGPRATCRWRHRGIHKVWLVVTDTNGMMTADWARVRVTRGRPPVARLNLSEIRSGVIRASARGSHGTSVSRLVAVKLRCGNGHATGWMRHHRTTRCHYRHPGLYKVTVIARNTFGIRDRQVGYVRVRR